MTKFWVKTILLETGERFPLLVSEDGPAFEPTVFAISQLRGKNLAFNTILQATRAVMVLLMMLKRHGIDLNKRIDKGELLTLGEVDLLVSYAKLEMTELTHDPDVTIPLKHRKVTSLETVRLNRTRRRAPGTVGHNTAAIRLTYIRQYLSWCVKVRALQQINDQKKRANLLEIGEIVNSAIQERTPNSMGRNANGERHGLGEEEQKLLLNVVELDHPRNPWSTPHAKERNALIIHMLIELGVRRGELLGIRRNDINAQKQEILLARRPDDNEDPRLNEPNGKTYERLLILSPQLLMRINDYSNGVRYAIPQARKHPFLIVASTGAPLSISGFNKLFKSLQDSIPELNHIFAHLLRHTFNDNMSDELEEAKMDGVQIWKSLLRLNGWSDRSKMPARYTKASTERKARVAHRSMQEKLNLKSRK